MDLNGITDEDDFTEIYDANIPRVDLVGKGANGIPFLMAKQDASGGLFDAGFVRDLIAKSDSGQASREVTMPQTVLPNGITVTGSAAAMAAFIHGAPVRKAEDDPEGVEKAEESTKSINDLPDSDFAYIEPGGKQDSEGKTTPRSKRHFPVHDAAHVRNALSRAPQSPFGEKAMGKIRSRAKKFGVEVSKEAGVPDDVSKADPQGAVIPDDGDLDGGVDGLDPTAVFADPDDDSAAGDATDPGSPAWEAIDAATARKWLSIASRLKNALGMLSDREALEAATADPDDECKAFSLQDAACSLDYAIGQLAVFAASEQAEADLGTEAMEAVGKALDGASPDLDVLEGLAAVRKAGRVLSSANESRIRDAAQKLNDVLASLPQAPTDGGPAAVTKEEGAVPDTQDKADDVAKASPEAPSTAPEAPAADAPAEAVAKEDAAPQEPEGQDVAKASPGQRPAPASKPPMDSLPPASVPAPEAPVAKASPVAILYDAAGELLGVAPSEAISRRVAKADSGDGEKQAPTVVFDEDGNILGIVDPGQIQPVTGVGGKKSEPKPDAAATPDSDAPDGSDLEPQPSASVGTPADGSQDDDEDVAKGTQAPGNGENTPMADVLKSIESVVRKALEAQEAAQQEAVAKAAAEQAEEIKALKARLEQVEKTPAAPGVFVNGQLPPDGSRPAPSQLRGQDAGAAPVDVAKAMERRKRLYQAQDAGEQNDVAKEMMGDAFAAISALQRR